MSSYRMAIGHTAAGDGWLSVQFTGLSGRNRDSTQQDNGKDNHNGNGNRN